jgi:two-component system, OmpR family, sensor histidine kinase TctE
VARAPRFFEWMIAPLLFIWLISLGATFVAARASADSAHALRLLAVAKIVAAEWTEATALKRTAEFPSAATRRWLSESTSTPLRFAVMSSEAGRGDLTNLQLLAGDDELAQVSRMSDALPISGRMDARANVAIDGVIYRSVELLMPSGAKVILAQNRKEDDALISDILLFEAIPQALILLVSGLLVAYGLAYVTKPMDALTELLSERSATKLHPIAVDAMPNELAPFLQSINELLFRLETSLIAQRRFIADAAHQLRTPLAALLVESQLVQRSGEGEARDAGIARIQAICERTSRLAVQLLSLARAESSNASLLVSSIDVCQVVQLICEDSASDALAKDIDFALELKLPSWTLPADATLFGEMLRNIIDNALKYTPKGGSVVVEVDPSLRCICVDDSGPGVPLREREYIFAPFTRGNHSLHTQDSSGSGLGLAIVREVAQLHHGKVSIESSSLGGARLIVRFS